MPLNVRRFGTSVLGVLLFSAAILFGQTAAPTQSPVPPQIGPPTSGDVMRDRISKSKAFIVVRNYNAAIYELENIRKESADPAVQSVVNVLLMNSYLEQGDFKRAQDLLNEFYAAQKTTKPNAGTNYMAVAGQVIKGARTRAERYKALGLNVSDRTLPLEALNDLEKMRETLEVVITQAKELGTDKAKAADAMAMLEEASSSRSMIARDTYDSRRWTDEVADTREKMASSRSVIMNAIAEAEPEKVQTPIVNKPVEPPPAPVQTVNTQASEPIVQPTPAQTREREVKIVGNADPAPTAASPPQDERPVYIPSTPEEKPVIEEPKKDVEKPAVTIGADPLPAAEAVKDDSPLKVGSLIPYATLQTKPVYPPAAKVIRASGVVRVEVMVDEDGTVAAVQRAEGPPMLQSAAKDAVKKWRFRPFVRDGQPVKATGFVSFSFAL